MVKPWNRISREVVDSPFLEVFHIRTRPGTLQNGLVGMEILLKVFFVQILEAFSNMNDSVIEPQCPVPSLSSGLHLLGR